MPESEIADILQEVFVKVDRGLADFHKESDQDNFRGWLCRITHREIANYRRRDQRRMHPQGGTEFLDELHQVPDQPPAEPSAEDATQETRYLYQQAVQVARGECSDSAWQIFWRVTVDGSTAAAVAVEFGATSAAVRQIKSRILRRLNQILGDVGE